MWEAGTANTEEKAIELQVKLTSIAMREVKMGSPTRTYTIRRKL